jgi:hypothetical protein
MDIPIILHRQIFKNKDGSEGILYLISNDIELDKESMETIDQKRWKVEVFHKNIKSHTGLAKSPAKKRELRAIIFSCHCSQAKNWKD